MLQPMQYKANAGIIAGVETGRAGPSSGSVVANVAL